MKKQKKKKHIQKEEKNTGEFKKEKKDENTDIRTEKEVEKYVEKEKDEEIKKDGKQGEKEQQKNHKYRKNESEESTKTYGKYYENSKKFENVFEIEKDPAVQKSTNHNSTIDPVGGPFNKKLNFFITLGDSMIY